MDGADEFLCTNCIILKCEAVALVAHCIFVCNCSAIVTPKKALFHVSSPLGNLVIAYRTSLVVIVKCGGGGGGKKTIEMWWRLWWWWENNINVVATVLEEENNIILWSKNL